MLVYYSIEPTTLNGFVCMPVEQRKQLPILCNMLELGMAQHFDEERHTNRMSSAFFRCCTDYCATACTI